MKASTINNAFITHLSHRWQVCFYAVFYIHKKFIMLAGTASLVSASCGERLFTYSNNHPAVINDGRIFCFGEFKNRRVSLEMKKGKLSYIDAETLMDMDWN